MVSTPDLAAIFACKRERIERASRKREIAAR